MTTGPENLSLRALVLEQKQLSERIYQLCGRREDVIAEVNKRLDRGDREEGVDVARENPLQSMADAVAKQLALPRVQLPLENRARDETAFWTNLVSVATLVDAFRSRPIIPCADCSGNGWITEQDPGTGDPVQVECERCYGTGEALPTLERLQHEIKRWTAVKGWADSRTVGDLIALMHSELSEALEEYRNNHEPNEVRVHAGKPEGIPIELADVVIRILSFCGKYDVDLQSAVLQKMAYNETREHRHGGKRV